MLFRLPPKTQLAKIRFSLIAAVALVLVAHQVSGQSVVIDQFNYASDVAAQAVWQNSSLSPPVEMTSSSGWGAKQVLALPVVYTSETSRCYWDNYIALDLTQTTTIELHVFVEDPQPISSFTLYFHSPSGWTAASVSVTQSGWQIWQWEKDEFSGWDAFLWDQVDRIRLSPWKAQEAATTLQLQKLHAFTPEVVIVEGNLSASTAEAQAAADDLFDIFTDWGVPCRKTTDLGVEQGALAEAKLAFLPWNSALSSAELTELENFVTSGGKVIACYWLPPRLAELLGLENQGWMGDQYPNQFSSYRFESADILGLPDDVVQHSWNIMEVVPDRTDARVIAWWWDSDNQQLDKAAWLASDTGAYLSHILLHQDMENERQLLLALAGYFRPECWTEVWDKLSMAMQSIGDHYSYAEMVTYISEKSENPAHAATIAHYLNQAEQLKDEAFAAAALDNYSSACLALLDARQALVEAYYYCHRPQTGEWRGAWEHSGAGAYPGDWERSARNLRAAGFTAVIANMMSGGLAHYNSAHLPHSSRYETYGDQLSQCVAAARSQGLEVHAWKVNWNCTSAPAAWRDAMRAADRFQLSVSGASIDWLCPSHPDNRQLEKDVMLEVVQNYDVDGVHFDYIRYPGSDYCYCDGCRSRFEQQTGNSVTDWPQECHSGALAAAYQEWRVAQINKLVEEVSVAARLQKPSIKISAAVFGSYPSSRNSVGQDWVSWIDNGYLDFICPMDYTTSFSNFRALVDAQMTYVDGRIPLYPGIGAYLLDPDGVIAQVLATRELGADGFTLFAFSAYADQNVFPQLAKSLLTFAIQTGVRVDWRLFF